MELNEHTEAAMFKFTFLVPGKSNAEDEGEGYKNAFLAGRNSLQSRLLKAEAELERERIRLAACGVAAMQNTKDSHGKNQVDKDSPYYSASYADVCAAVDREMSLMVQLKASKERAGRLDVAQRILHEIMRSGTGPEGNSIEASLAYEGLAFLAGERTIDDLKRIKALPKDFALDAKRGEV